MTCREATNLLPRFFDGELDAHQMRAVALHSTRCVTCEEALRELERVQELVSHSIGNGVDEIDFNGFWPAIGRGLSTAKRSWRSRLSTWWRDGEREWLIRVPAVAAAAGIAGVTPWVFTRLQPTPTQPGAPPGATRHNPPTH